MRKLGVIVLSIIMVLMAAAHIGIVAEESYDGDVADGTASRASSRKVKDLQAVTNGLPNDGNFTTTLFSDLDGDEYLDIVAGSYGFNAGEGLTALTSNFGIGWLDASTGLPNTGSYGHGAVADVDNDNNDDFIVPYYQSTGQDGIEVWLSNGGAGGSVSWTHGVDPINTSSFFGLAAGDVNNDGDIDIVASDQMGGLEFWWGNGGTGWVANTTGLPTTSTYYNLAFGDLNEDGLLDIVACWISGVKIYTYNGDQTWTDNSTGMPFVSNPQNVKVGDIDNDNNLDILVATNINGVQAYTGNGGVGGAFTWTADSQGLPTSNGYRGLALDHVDQDGNLDVVIGSQNGNIGAALYVGDGGEGGSMSWSEKSLGKLPVTGMFYGADIADFNTDNTGDILVGSGSDNGIIAWRTIAPISDPPVADAGTDRNTFVNRTVTLNGSASWDDTMIVEYDWNITSQPAASSIALSDETIAMPTFVPEIAGTYNFSLTVKDEHDFWALEESTVTVTVKVWPNERPIPNAGDDLTVMIFDEVQLDGSGSTDDAGIKSYDWNVTTQPEESALQFSDESAEKPTVVPEYVGTYRITLTVQDINNTWGEEDQMVLEVKPYGEARPYANAGADQVVEMGDPVTLNATGSSDDIDIIEYNWTVSGQPAGSNLFVTDEAEPTVTPEVLGKYFFELKVRDTDNLVSDPDTVKVEVVPKDLDPTAMITAPLDGQEFLTIHDIKFDASESSDPEGSTLTYRWESNIDGFLSNLKTFEWNLTEGTHLITLLVEDDHKNNATAYITIKVKEDKYPTPVLTANLTLVLKDQLITFDGSGSNDPEGKVYDYLFKFGDGQDSGWVKQPTFQHAYATSGTYGATLKVKDSIGQMSGLSKPVMIKVGIRPVAKITASAEKVTVKKKVDFDATASTDQDGNVSSYYFDFGDKTNSGWVENGKLPHTYKNTGRFTVRVKVKDNDGFISDAATVTVKVEQEQQQGMDMATFALPIALIVVVIIVTIIASLVLKKRALAEVKKKEQEAKEAARPKEDFTEVDALLSDAPAQPPQQPPPPQPPPDQGYEQQGYDQQQYYQQDQVQQGYDQGQTEQYQYPPQQ
jgi:hypothetical protein